MEKSEKALKEFKLCKNCAEAVLKAYKDEINLDDYIIKNISAGFEKGMFVNKTCGAITGAIMVLGILKSNKKSIIGKRELPYIIKKLFKEIEKDWGSSQCFELKKNKKNCNLIVQELVGKIEKLL